MKHLTMKTTVLASLTHVQVVVDHTPPIQLQRSAKLKISHWFYWSVYLAYQVFICYQESILSNRFATLFTSWQPLNKTFIFSSKSRCCSGTFTNALFTSLLTKKHLTKILIIFRYIHSAFPQLYCLKFSFKLANISRSYEENKTASFSVYGVV